MLATYNEALNVPIVYSRLRKIVPNADILFVDDNSPDGTGGIIDNLAHSDSKVFVLHRSKKMGVGSAHRDGICWAYKQNYTTLVTMDCDLTHSPDFVPLLLKEDPEADIVVGSRFIAPGSLSEWGLYRRALTYVGHFLTDVLLGMSYDATGAFRRYNLERIPIRFLNLVESDGYAFFFESLHVLHFNGFRIGQVPVGLPARTHGTSKMNLSDIVQSIQVFVRQISKRALNKTKLLLSHDSQNGHGR